VSAPGFDWISSSWPSDGFGNVAEDIVRRLIADRDRLRSLLAACESDPLLFHRLVCDRGRFADLGLCLFHDGGSGWVELNLWRGGRNTTIHRHTFEGASGWVTGTGQELLFAGPPGIEIPRRVKPAGGRHLSQGDVLRVRAARPGFAGTIHSVLHDGPVAITVVARRGCTSDGVNWSWNPTTFELSGHGIEVDPSHRETLQRAYESLEA